MMRVRLALCVVLVGVLLYAATVVAQDVRVPTRTYQLDSGQHVRTWLDEPIGVWCLMLLDGTQPVGVSCVAISETAYAWPVQP